MVKKQARIAQGNVRGWQIDGSVFTHSCNPTMWEAEARGFPQVLGQPDLLSKFKVSLSYCEILSQGFVTSGDAHDYGLL